jgi:hypothetical protein
LATFVRAVPLLIAAVCAPAALLAQVDARTLPPESPGPLRTFWRDTLAQRVELRGGTLEVFAERDHANLKATTGRYVVRWNGLQVAVSEDSVAALPLVAAVAAGSPTVVALGTGTHLKIIVLEPAREQGSIAARAYSVEVPEKGSSDPLRVVSGPDNGAFVLGTAAFALKYSGGTLRLEAAGSREAGAGRALVPGGENEYVAAMKADLRNLVAAEAAFFADGAKYADRLPALKLRLTGENRLIRLRLSPDGWTALIGNANTRTVCAVFVGSVAAAPAKTAGEPACI